MVYKKYIEKRGKVFGPYYYESYRENGRVNTRFVSGPKFLDRLKNKKFFILEFIMSLFLLILLAFFIINNSSENSSSVVGFIISEVSNENIEQKFEKDFDLEIKEPIIIGGNRVSKNKNERMDFGVENGLRLYFELLNYSEFVRTAGEVLIEDGLVVESEIVNEESINDNLEELEKGITGQVIGTVTEVSFENLNVSKVKEKIEDLDDFKIEEIAKDSVLELENEEFHIEVDEEKAKEEDVDYKWGYEVELKDLNFIAKIDVTSDDSISIYDENSLRIGRNLISFNDLIKEGYSVKFEIPSLDLEISEVTDSVINVTDVNIIDGVTNVTDTVNNFTDSGDINNTNITLEKDVVKNDSDVINENVNESINEDIDESINEKNQSNEGVNESVKEENQSEDFETGYGEIVSENEGIGITGNMVAWLTGFVIGEIEDMEYANTITVYIEKDFNGTNYSVGDVINLDPSLIVIPITDAEHLDENRNFINNIYELVKTKDDNWSEIIETNDYVRVTFEQDLDKSKDITIYARSSDKNVSSIEVYRKDSEEIVTVIDNINLEGWYKTYLSELGEDEMQGVFDLKILGNIEFDYIVDPEAAPNQSWNATFNYTGGAGLERVYGIVVDSDRDCVYVTGFTEDAGVPLANTIKYNATNGDKLWNVTDTYASKAESRAIDIDSDGNVYVTGIDGFPGFNDQMFYTIKYDPNGTNLWESVYNPTGSINDVWDLALGISYNSNNSEIYVVGTKNNTNWVILSYYLNGSQDSVITWGSDIDSDLEIAKDVAVDSLGNFYVIGVANISGTMLSHIKKYNISGNELFNISSGSIPNQTIETDSNDNFYIGGGYNGSYFILKYNSSGVQLWNVSYDGGGADIDYGIAVDNDSNVYVTGIANGNYNTVKYNSSGSYLWNISYDSGGSDEARGIALDSDNNIYVSGTASDDYFTIKYLQAADTTAPEISIGYPTNNTNTSDTGIDVNYTTSGSPQACWYSNDSMSVNTTLASCVNITTVTWINGQHNVTIWANDSSGNENSSSIVFTVDTVAPSLNFTSPTSFSGDLVYRDLLVNVSFSGGDNATVYLFNSSKAQINSSINTSAGRVYVNFSGLTSGVYYFNVTSMDSLGNRNDSVTRNVVLFNGSNLSDGSVKNSYKINESRFGNGAELSGDLFGTSLANIGDLNGDGVIDIAVGEYQNDDGGDNNGAVWIMFLNTTGGVSSEYKINESRFGNGNELEGSTWFGISVANIGDLNNDGVQDIAVGELHNNDGGALNGAVWILFLNTSGGVINEYKINESRFGNGNELGGNELGYSIANIGDLNNDGVQDIAVGEYLCSDGGASNGAVWIMFLNTSGGVINEYKINESRFGNGAELSGDSFGISLADIGDLNNDGVTDIAVGEYQNDDGGASNGAVWIMFLNTSGGVDSEYKINSSRFGNGSELNGNWFGVAVAGIGDVNNDSVEDIVVGEPYNDDGGNNNGAVWIMFLNTTGGVSSEYKINESRFGDGNELNSNGLGNAVSSLGDLNNDGVQDIAVGEWHRADGGTNEGAVWIMFLNGSSGLGGSDSVSPNVTINYPSGGWYAASSINFNVTAVDDTLINSCWYSLDSGVNNVTMINSTVNDDYNHTNTSIGDGEYLLNVYCNDSSSNINNSESVNTFSVDTTPPSWTNISNYTYVANSSTGFSKTIVATDSGVSSNSYWLNDTTYFNVTPSGGVINNATNMSRVEIHWLNVSVNDSLGNTNSTVIFINVTADLNGPNVTLIDPINSSSSAATAYNFTFNVSDVTVVDNCSLIVDGSVIQILNSLSMNSQNGMYNDSFSVSTHNWSVNCSDSSSNVGNSSMWNFTVIASSSPGGGGGGGGGGSVLDDDDDDEVEGEAEIEEVELVEEEEIDFEAEEEFPESEFKELVKEDGEVVEIVEVHIKDNFRVFECSDWEECNSVYDLDNLIEGNLDLDGEQIRYCDDGLLEVIKRRPCTIKKFVSIKRDGNGLEFYDEDINSVVAELNLVYGDEKKFKKLNIALTGGVIGSRENNFNKSTNLLEIPAENITDPINAIDFFNVIKVDKIYFSFIIFIILLILIILIILTMKIANRINGKFK